MVTPASPAPDRSPKRTPPRYVALADAILARIVSGEFPDGSQLPPERELARESGVAYLTVRQAIGLLVKRGVIARRHGHGTFVKSGARKEWVALVCGPELRKESAHFYRAMIRALELEGGKRNFDFRIYDGLTNPHGELCPEGSQIRRGLQADLSNYAFVGLIEIAPGRQSLWRDAREIPAPRVVFEAGDAATDLEFDFHDFGKAAIRHLAGRGCRRIAMMPFSSGQSGRSGILEGAFEAVAEMGLPSLKVHVTDMPKGEREIHTGMLDLIRGWRRKGASPPDGLVVGEDIAMRSVALALIQSGHASEHPLPIVCQACEGTVHHYGLPVSRYELEIGRAARSLLNLLEQKMRGGPLPRLPVKIGGILKEDIL